MSHESANTASLAPVAPDETVPPLPASEAYRHSAKYLGDWSHTYGTVLFFGLCSVADVAGWFVAGRMGFTETNQAYDLSIWLGILSGNLLVQYRERSNARDTLFYLEDGEMLRVRGTDLKRYRLSEVKRSTYWLGTKGKIDGMFLKFGRFSALQIEELENMPQFVELIAQQLPGEATQVYRNRYLRSWFGWLILAAISFPFFGHFLPFWQDMLMYLTFLVLFFLVLPRALESRNDQRRED